ncbi:MAG: AGE family epimerase/isomerase [Bryobacteraceae bacterium]
MSLETYAARYRKDLLDSVIPFWMKHAPDREFGGYFTCLDRAGAIYDTRKYVWMQGRMVWMFSKLYNELDRRPEWLEMAALGIGFLRRHARDAKGRCYFSLTREGNPAFYQRKPYAAVFTMMGLLEYSKATGDEEMRAEAIALFWSIREWIASPELMDRPVFPGPPAVSSLADIMVVASMAMELAAVSDDPRYGEVMRECLAAAFPHYDPERRILMENAGFADTPEGRLFCPGSSLEVAWFLLHLLQRFPDDARRRQVLEIIEGSLEFGWDGEFGGLYYFMDVNGRPTLQLESSMKLWWPHTEAIYAVLLAHSISGDEKWMAWLERLDTYAYKHFADPEYGEWFGYCDRQGNLTHSLKGNNYKGSFHVPRFLLLSIQLLERHRPSA